ncbi:hypothetical protein [Streptomyces sp. NPDC006334]|uniref:hypothetical protein n=1 Tax=Streptomyces sp. NPDC006334 TaxID=3156754 RepID=UPI0033A0277A
MEFEGPTEIYQLARRLHTAITAKLTTTTIVGPFITTQARFDAALADARRDLLVLSPAPDQAARIVEAHEALQALAAERAVINSSTPRGDAMELAEVMFAPIVQRVASINRETGEAVSLVTQGMSRVLIAIVSAAPDIARAAMGKVQQCEGFNEQDAATLIINYGAGILPVFQQEMQRITVSTRAAREAFLRETDKHLDGRLPVLRNEQ